MLSGKFESIFILMFTCEFDNFCVWSTQRVFPLDIANARNDETV